MKRHAHHGWHASLREKQARKDELILKLRKRVCEMRLRKQDPSEFLRMLAELGWKEKER